MLLRFLSAAIVLGLISLWACSKSDDSDVPTETVIESVDGPLGLTLINDGITYAGTSVIDITPEITETFDDTNGNGAFDGCFDDPLAERCAEGFDDANGNGVFDPIFIGGYEPLRPANHITAPISVRALVLTHNPSGYTPTEYVAWVTIDVLGLNGKRGWAAADMLAEEGFDRDRLMVTSTHNHQAPDTVGLFGDPLNLISGYSEDYQATITDAIASSVREAAARVKAVDITVGQTWMHQENNAFNGTNHGGVHPLPSTFGMINDLRDPRVVSDQLLVIRGTDTATDGGVFTLTSWAGHPEVEGGKNLGISADWVGTARDALESKLGGTAIHVPEALGGMQSALYMALPLVDAEGVHHFATCGEDDVLTSTDSECYGQEVGTARVDASGNPVPIFAPTHTREVSISHGWHIAEAAIKALESGERVDEMALDIEAEPLFIPINNPLYSLVFPLNVIDYHQSELITDPTLCPEVEESPALGCFTSRVFRLRLGPVEFLTAPAEVTPEIAWGVPDDDPTWTLESTTLSSRGPQSSYFTQHSSGCDNVTFDECRNEKTVGDCDCLLLHASPFLISDNPSQRPILELSQAKYKAIVSMTDSYFSYALPETDINYQAAILDDYQGDHYEEAITMSYFLSSKLWEAHDTLNVRW